MHAQTAQMTPRVRYALAVLCLAVIGCAHVVPDQKLDRHSTQKGYRFSTLPSPGNSDSLFIVLTFSGGGTRAAALAYGTLEHLSRTEIQWEGQQRRLLDEVDIVSSVSGGSVTAAYFGLYGEGIFRDFEQRFLKRDVQAELSRRFLWPGNWPRLASSRFGRSDIVAEHFDKLLFSGKTYGDLLRRGRRPFVLLNATDMAAGNRFEFTQDQFDPLCADLGAYPIARAVAASSAFPILLSPITVHNFAGQCGYREPPWVAAALQERQLSSRRFSQANDLRSYQDAKQRPYIHLLDGGLADNLGLRGPLDAVISEGDAWSLTTTMGIEEVRKIVFIMVNAQTGADLSWNRREGIPGLRQVVDAIKRIPIDRYTFETKELLKSSVERWGEQINSRRQANGDKGEPASFYLIDVDFDALRDGQERAFYKSIPTNFHLPGEVVDKVRGVAARILEESVDFARLKRDLAP
jgi:NTE family protein